jgi:hypothetical protein
LKNNRISPVAETLPGWTVIPPPGVELEDVAGPEA